MATLGTMLCQAHRYETGLQITSIDTWDESKTDDASVSFAKKKGNDEKKGINRENDVVIRS